MADVVAEAAAVGSVATEVIVVAVADVASLGVVASAVIAATAPTGVHHAEALASIHRTRVPSRLSAVSRTHHYRASA